MVNRKALKKLNAAIVAKPIAAALTDKQVRALAKGTAAETGIETALRKSRRVNAKYNAAHVHTGADPKDNHVDPSAEAGAAKGETKLTHAVEGSSGARREAQLAHPGKTESGEFGSARRSFGDGVGVENTSDGENVAGSAGETVPNAGPRFDQTQRAARGKVAAAENRRQMYERLAWDAFELDHDTDAAAIMSVWERLYSRIPDDSGQVPGPITLARRDPDKGYAVALVSFLKGVRAPGRARREAELKQSWKDWRAYRVQWERAHPNACVPWIHADRTRERVRGFHSLPVGIAHLVGGATVYQAGTAPAPAVTAQEPWRVARDAVQEELRQVAAAEGELLAEWLATATQVMPTMPKHNNRHAWPSREWYETNERREEVWVWLATVKRYQAGGRLTRRVRVSAYWTCELWIE